MIFRNKYSLNEFQFQPKQNTWWTDSSINPTYLTFGIGMCIFENFIAISRDLNEFKNTNLFTF